MTEKEELLFFANCVHILTHIAEQKLECNKCESTVHTIYNCPKCSFSYLKKKATKIIEKYDVKNV